MSRGIFITFEGIDGSGKTTQLRLLAERLRQAGRDVVEAVEPGGTEIGRQVRAIVLDGRNKQLTPRAEVLLYFASRAQNVEEVIRPAIAAGKVVLCDRFTDSTLVYQGCARGLGADVVLALDGIACQGLKPDLTVLVDIDLDESLARARFRNVSEASNETRLEDESTEFHRAVRDGYRSLAKREAERFLVIDGNAAIDVVAERVWEAVAPHA
ncbi:MAG TPA: dTMP kinase [Bryobacteraceae bacterium]|jgi:dTMP kinase